MVRWPSGAGLSVKFEDLRNFTMTNMSTLSVLGSKKCLPRVSALTMASASHLKTICCVVSSSLLQSLQLEFRKLGLSARNFIFFLWCKRKLCHVIYCIATLMSFLLTLISVFAISMSSSGTSACSVLLLIRFLYLFL